MKATLVLLMLAVVAVSNAAVLKGPERFLLIIGSIGPGDSRLTTIENDHTPIEGITLNWVEIGFSMPTVELTIAYIRVVDQLSSGARAEIVSGGVGADHVRIRYTPYDNRAFSFVAEVFGSYIVNQRSGALPEMVTVETKNTSPQ